MSDEAVIVKLETVEDNSSPRDQNVGSDQLDRGCPEYDESITVKKEQLCDASFDYNMLKFDAATEANTKGELKQAMVQDIKLENSVVTEKCDWLKTMKCVDYDDTDGYKNLNTRFDEQVAKCEADEIIKTEGNECDSNTFDVDMSDYAASDENVQVDLRNSDNAIKHEIEEFDLKKGLTNFCILKDTEHKQTRDFTSECENLPDEDKPFFKKEVNYSEGYNQESVSSVDSRTGFETVFLCDFPGFVTKCETDMLNHVGSAQSKEIATKYYLLDNNNVLYKHGIGEVFKYNVHEYSATGEGEHKERQFKCTQCDYRSARKQTLLRHVMCIHSEFRPFKCDMCEYSTVVKGNLLKHAMSKHSEHRPFKCDKCDYSTADRQNLMRHVIRKHSKEKPFKCDRCDYSATMKANLVKHVMSKHSGHKPFMCDMCDYKTVTKAVLVRHTMGKHSNQRPFKCDICGHSSVMKHDLARHVMSKHSEQRPFKCDTCNFSTAHKRNLTRHVTYKHR